MSRTTQAGAAAIAAGAFVISGATVIGHHIPDQHWGTRGAVLDVAFAIGALAVAVALPAVAVLVGAARLGRIGTRIAQAGFAAIAVECIASTIHDGNTLGPVFMLGLLGAIAGLALLAVDGVRSGQARMLAALPVLALVVGIAAGNVGGAIALGVIWAGLAVVITRVDQPTRAMQPAVG